MSLLEPLGLLGLAALAPIIALYFLKLKRQECVVPSTLLWKKVLDDLQVNSPFQRLKYSLLLLLQMLLIALLGFALARPYLSGATSSGHKTILLIDTSASMATRDAGPGKDLTRLEAAVRDATAKLGDMRPQDEMMVIAFDRDVRQLTQFTSDRAALRDILGNLKPRDVATRAGDAFETALSLCEGRNDVRVLVLSDGCFGNLKALGGQQPKEVKGNLEDRGTTESAAPLTALERLARQLGSFRFVSYGEDTSDNSGITQIEARTRPVKATDDEGKRFDALETQVFIMVENFAPKERDIILSLSIGDGRPQAKVIHLAGRPPRTETLADAPVTGAAGEPYRSVEVFKLPVGWTGNLVARIDAPKDKLPADDTAYCIVGTAEGFKLLYVTNGNYFLEKALGAVRGVTVKTMTPAELTTLWDQKGAQCVEGYDACIFEGAAPVAWNEGGALFLGAMPPLPGFAKAEKRLEWPPLLDWNTTHPVMRYVNFGNVTVAEAQAWTAPKTARVLVEAGGGPLMVAVENDRMRVLGVAFDFFKTDWAYRPSLPLFLRNVVPWLAESSPRRHPTALHTGEPLVILPGLGAPTAKLQRPGNEAPEEVALSGERSVFVKGTETAGLYRLKYEVNDAAQERAYAVNLASRDESDNAARGRLKIGDVTFESTPSAIEAKREIWRDLVLAAAVLLLLEWWVFHRRVGM